MTIVQILCAKDGEVTRESSDVVSDSIIEKDLILRVHCVIFINIWAAPSVNHRPERDQIR